MVVQLSSLRVAPELDAGKYTAGAQQKVAADRAMAASSAAAGQAVVATDAKISASGDVLARLSRQYVQGYSAQQRFNSGLGQLGRALDAGKISTEQASTIIVGMNQKLGLMGDASDLASKGQLQLAAAVKAANLQIEGQMLAADRAATAGTRLRAANENHYNGVRGFNQFNTANIAAQFQDIGITSAMGMSPLQIALQQGTQLQAVLGPMGAAGAARALGSAFLSLISPVSLVTIGLVGITAAAIQFGSKLGGSNREAEEFAKWLEKIGGNANKSADFVDKLTDALRDMSGIDLSKLAAGGAADIAKMRSELKNPLAGSTGLMGLAGGYLGADPAFVQEYELIEKILTRLRSDEGFKSLEELRRDLALIVAQRPELQKYAETWEVLGENILKARDAVEEARRQADYRLHGMGAYQPRNGTAVQKYYSDNAGTLRQLQIDQEVSLQRIGARSPSELAAVARAAERAKPINGEESPEVRRFREDSAAALAYAEAQHTLAEAQRDRVRAMDDSIASQKFELSLVGKTGGEVAGLRFEFEHIQQVRAEAARNGIAVDEKEIALIKAKAAEAACFADRVGHRCELQLVFTKGKNES